MSWRFSANLETSCRRRATTPVQWNLQNSGDVALLLYVWSPWPDMRSIQHLVLTKSWLGKIWEKLPSHISCHLMLSHAVSCRLNTYRAQAFPTCMTGRQSASSIHARCSPSTYPLCRQTRSESVRQQPASAVFLSCR